MGKSLLERRQGFPPGSPTNTAITSTSTAAVATGAGSGLNLFVISVTTNCYIRFGLSTVAAATSADYPLFANEEYVLEVPSNQITHYRLIRASADGVASAYIVGGA